MTTIKFDSVYDLYTQIDECPRGVDFTERLGFDTDKVEILQCGLQEDIGVYASLPQAKNILIADTEDLCSQHLKGEGEITVCLIKTPDGEMFDEPEVEVKQLGTFNDFDAAYAAFTAAINEESKCEARVFYESDRPMLQQLADDLNAKMKRTDARVIVTDGAEDNLILMVVGFADGEVSDEYGFFLDLPYTDEEGVDENYVLHYAGYPNMNDYTFRTVDLGQLSAAIEELDLL